MRANIELPALSLCVQIGTGRVNSIHAHWQEARSSREQSWLVRLMCFCSAHYITITFAAPQTRRARGQSCVPWGALPPEKSLGVRSHQPMVFVSCCQHRFPHRQPRMCRGVKRSVMAAYLQMSGDRCCSRLSLGPISAVCSLRFIQRLTGRVGQ